MGNVLVQESSLSAIADAIRSKNGSQSTYKPAQMSPAISALDTKPGLKQPYVTELDTGYVMNGEWVIGGGTINYSDVYRVSAGRIYLFSLGDVVGTRFRAMFSTEDTSQAVSNVSGVTLVNTSNPVPYAYKSYTPETDGYITITKDNAGQAGLHTVMVCLQELVEALM